jgi:predicted GIY-YIG superfamily endonuclease
MQQNKEFLYVGYYIVVDNNYILKIGTTNDLHRRQQEHNRNYRRAKSYTLPKDKEFVYLWHLPLSKYNTIRYEDQNRANWANENIGKFIRNDRFLITSPIEYVSIKIRKEYLIKL